MYQQRTFILILVSIIGFNLQSQTTPYLSANSKVLNTIAQLQLPRQNNEVLLAEEMERRGPGVAPRFAQKMEVDISPATHGTWNYRNGMAIWHLRIPSPGAKSLNFGFAQYEMPPGGQLLLFDPAQREVLGPFTPADNEAHEQLWTPVIAGDDIILEVSVPMSQQQNLKLHLTSVNHDFLGFLDVTQNGGRSGSCNLDVACGAADGWGIVDEYRDIIQSVVNYGFSGNVLCTGFLVNTVREDCTAYFMTADHCGVGPNEAPSLVFYWNYQNSFCREPGTTSSGNPGNGSLSNFNTGAIYRAGFAPSDFVLLELDDPVPASANAFFAGWDAREGLEQDTVITIHHPNNEEKRISFAFTSVYRGAWGQAANAVPNGNHLIVRDWDIGTTEGGSSGAPLFDSDKRVVGQLHGGQAACGNDGYDSYGWFASSWEGGGTPETRLKDWLDPDNTGIKVSDGRVNSQCSLFATALPVGQSVCIPAVANYDIQVSPEFNGPVSLSLENLPGGLTADFANNTVSPGGVTQLTLGNTTSLSPGEYIFRLIGTDGANEVDQLLQLMILADVPDTPSLLFPLDGASDQSTMLSFDWTNEMAPEGYELEVATDLNFANIFFSSTGLSASSFTVSDLARDTDYFWRVRARNVCGVGAWSTVYTFSTTPDLCIFATANTSGLTIGPNAGMITNSTVEVTQAGQIDEIKLNNLSTDHSFVGDLSATLTSPAGTTIQLFNQTSCQSIGMLVDFADAASATAADFEAGCSPGDLAAIEGEFQPAQALAAFIGEQAQGTWTLSIQDNAFFDGGDLLGWNLEICIDSPTTTIDIGGTALKIWPNPTNGPVQLHFEEAFSGEVNAAIHSVTGRFIRQTKLQVAGNRAALDLTDLPSGVYVLRIQHEANSAVTRIVRH